MTYNLSSKTLNHTTPNIQPRRPTALCL